MSARSKPDAQLAAAARSQLGRIAHLDRFPEDSLALDDYIGALVLTGTPAGIAAVMDRYVEAGFERCESASTFAVMARRWRAEQARSRAACAACSGNGWVVRWYLVTFHGHSFAVRRQELLPDVLSDEAAQMFREKLNYGDAVAKNDRQDVRCAAARCACMSGLAA